MPAAIPDTAVPPVLRVAGPGDRAESAASGVCVCGAATGSQAAPRVGQSDAASPLRAAAPSLAGKTLDLGLPHEPFEPVTGRLPV
jgi:hypothetical protein